MNRGRFAARAALLLWIVAAGACGRTSVGAVLPVRADEVMARAEESHPREVRIPADRGLILDRNRRILVDQRPGFDVTLTAARCSADCEAVLRRLAGILPMTPGELEDGLARLGVVRASDEEQARPFAVRLDVPREKVDAIETRREELPGVDVLQVPRRSYRYAALGAHFIGYVNEAGARELEPLNQELRRAGAQQGPYSLGDVVGRRGLERRFERALRGVDGVRFLPVDVGRSERHAVGRGPDAKQPVPSHPGQNLVLSIDWRLQELAEKNFTATAGVVLAMDAKTGFLLALVARPAVDPNRISGRISGAELMAIHEDPLQPELFRAIQQRYRPGSTFEPVTAIAALEEGIVRPASKVHCMGRFSMGPRRWRCDEDSGHGAVDLEHALGAGCDGFFHAAGAGLGADALARWAHALGLGRLTGYEVAGEEPGVVPDVAWHDSHVPGGYRKEMAVDLGAGQGEVFVTPMQELVMYGALATGTLWRPQLVLRVEDAEGRVVQGFSPEARSTLRLQPSTRDTVLKGLVAAVNPPHGSGGQSSPGGVRMAGKTGTAQVVRREARRSRAGGVPYFERDHAWFAGFAPAEDPEIVVVVLDEHSGIGASNAGATARALVKKFFELKAADAAGATRADAH